MFQVEPPEGWHFEPVSVTLTVDGHSDLCSQAKDINFYFKGFSVYGQVSKSHYQYMDVYSWNAY